MMFLVSGLSRTCILKAKPWKSKKPVFDLHILFGRIWHLEARLWCEDHPQTLCCLFQALEARASDKQVEEISPVLAMPPGPRGKLRAEKQVGKD